MWAEVRRHGAIRGDEHFGLEAGLASVGLAAHKPRARSTREQADVTQAQLSVASTESFTGNRPQRGPRARVDGGASHPRSRRSFAVRLTWMVDGEGSAIGHSGALAKQCGPICPLADELTLFGWSPPAGTTVTGSTPPATSRRRGLVLSCGRWVS